MQRTVLRSLCDTIRALCGDARGNAAMVFGLVMPAVLIAVGAGIDYGNLTSIKINLQQAADAAALTGARELRLSNIAAATVQSDMTNFAMGNLKGGNFTASVSPSVNMVTRTATVQISAAAPTYIMQLLGGSRVKTLTATASAQIKGGDPICIIALDQTSPISLKLEADAQVQAPGCVVYSNSTLSTGLIAQANSKLTAAMICSAGGATGAGKGSFVPTPQTDCPIMPDPLAGRPTPKIGSCTQTNLVVSGQYTTLFPGTYCGGITITNASNVTMAAGVYVIQGGPLDVNGGSTMNGVNTGFFFTGAGAALNFETDSNISLTAPKDGVMAGMLFWEHASVPTGKSHQITSGNARTLLGTIYFPKNQFYVASNAPVADQSAYTVVVAKNFFLSAGPTMVLNTNYGATDIPVPNGVGPGGLSMLVQ